MKINKEKYQIPFGETKEFLRGRFYIGVNYSESGNNNLIKVTAGKDGLGHEDTKIYLGKSHTFLFQNLYEVRVFKITCSYVTIQVCELPIIDTAEGVFQSSTIFNESTPDEKFNNQEIKALRAQLSSLEAKINDLHKLTDTEANHVKSSFEVLNEKLDTSTKEVWRQTAYGVLVSVGLSISIDINQAVNFYTMAETYLSSATNLLILKS